MKFSKILFLLVPVLVICLAACVSCSSSQPIELKKVESVKILNTSGDGVDLELTMQLRNPNFLRFTITNADLNIVFNKIDLGKAVLKNNVLIPGNSELSQKFVVHVGASNALLGGFASLLSLFKKNTASVSLVGTIRARSFGISKSFPVNESTNIPFSL